MAGRTTWNETKRIKTNATNDVEPTEPKSSEVVHQSKNDAATRMEIFDAEIPLRDLDNLIVPEATSRQIYSLLAKVRYHHILYEEWGLHEIDPHGGRTAINLYGPPGTGKSSCAEAIAKELDKKIIRVNYAEIESKYVGDTPKNIKAAFSKAKMENAVLFFDEADSILGKRLTNVTQSADHGVNVSRSVMLLELDRFDGVTIFATNLASNYDSAFVRRILGHVEMPLPDFDGRKKLWELHIPHKMPTQPNPFSDEEYRQLAENSEDFSGGDILNAVITGALEAVQRDEPERHVKVNDFLEAIASLTKAKEDVGNLVKTSKKTLTYEELPLDVQQKISSRQSNQDKN
jgi:SpoVK/Ycf46/Vps4 family AAA+-type ATPase